TADQGEHVTGRRFHQYDRPLEVARRLRCAAGVALSLVQAVEPVLDTIELPLQLTLREALQRRVERRMHNESRRVHAFTEPVLQNAADRFREPRRDTLLVLAPWRWIPPHVQRDAARLRSARIAHEVLLGHQREHEVAA